MMKFCLPVLFCFGICMCLIGGLFSQDPFPKMDPSFRKGVGCIQVEVRERNEEGWKPTRYEQFHYNTDGHLILHSLQNEGKDDVMLDSIFYNDLGDPIREVQIWPEMGIYQENRWNLQYAEGKLIHKEDRSSGLTHRFEFDPTGKFVREKAFFTSDSTFFSEDLKRFDGHGNLISRKERMPWMVKEWFGRYDDEGHLSWVRTTEKVTAEPLAPKVREISFSYGPTGLLFHQYIHDQHGKHLSSIHYIYNEQGLLICKRLPEGNLMYDWNDQEQLIQIKRFVRGKLVATKRYNYLKEGLPILATSGD